jgi:hypothetical protein
MGGRSRVCKLGSSTGFVVSAIRLHPLSSLLQLGMVQEEPLITLKTSINLQLKGQLLRNVVSQKLLQLQLPPLLPLQDAIDHYYPEFNPIEFNGKLSN